MQESEFTGCVNKVQGKAAERLKNAPLKALMYRASRKSAPPKNHRAAPSAARKGKPLKKISAPLALTLLAASCRIN
jgi:hypothetical protein